MQNNDRLRELRQKIKKLGRSSLTPQERIEFKQLSPINRTSSQEGDWKEIRAILDRLQGDNEAIKKQLKKLEQRTRGLRDL